MIGTSKPLASLSSSLLARKGQARPAMRPQGFLQMNTGPQEDLGWNDMGHDFQQAPVQMPYVAPVDEAIEAPKPAVLRQLEALDEQLAAPAHAPEPEQEPEFAPAEYAVEAEVDYAPLMVPARKMKREPVLKHAPEVPEGTLARVVREVASKKAKAAFTLRLDQERHLKLRLASAITCRSAQQLVTQALDQFLETLEGIDALAGQIEPAANRG
jgi:predicted transcriptional regulator